MLREPHLAPLLEELEPRILYAADLAPAVLAGLGELQPSWLEQSGVELQATRAHEVAFIDLALPQAQALIHDLAVQAASGRAIEVVAIEADADGIAVIGHALAQRQGVTAVHLLGHGSDGVLRLGAAQLDASSLLARAGEFAQWGAALSANADLLLYGCDVAASPDGQAVAASLAALTGADVAASTDLTGAAAGGGDWALEYSTGRIDAAVAPQAGLQQSFTGVLAITETGTSSGATVGTQSTLSFAHAVAAGANRLLVVQVMSANDVPVTSVTYNGSALTLLASATSSSNEVRAEVWILKSPQVGGSSVEVNTASSTRIVAGAISFTGVDQTTPTGPVWNAASNDAAPTLAVASALGERVLDIAGALRVTGHSVGPGQAQAWSDSNGIAAGDVWAVSSTEPGAAAVTMSHSFTSGAGASNNWVLLATTIKPTSPVAPVITSDGGGATAAISVAENTSLVTTVQASDADGTTPTYSIAGGADAVAFQIDPGTGVLTFNAANLPDFEAPGDVGLNNVYEVTVRGSDGTLTSTQALTITVTDVGSPLAVTTTADVLDGDVSSIEALVANPGADGLISLREAISASNNTPGSDTLVLPAGTYTITRAGAGEELNATGDFDITASITLLGSGAATTVIDGDGLDRVFDVLGGASTLSGLTIRDGDGGPQGGGIAVGLGAALNLGSVIVTANVAISGAGIYSQGNTTLADVRLTGNGDATTVTGGGLNNSGSATLTRVTVDNNTATRGAGIYSIGPALTIDNSTISGNVGTGTAQGGGLYTNQTGYVITNSTIAYNSAAFGGGGLYTAASNAISIGNTILANNTGGNNRFIYPQQSLGYNLDTGGSAGLLDGTDRRFVAANLDPLAANGGFAPTHALQAGSPAIDNGNPAAPAADQRGVARSGAPDIGAFELALASANRSPVNALPAAQTALEDVSTAIAGVSVSDPDQGGGTALHELSNTALSVANGTLQVTLSGSAVISVGANASASFALSGSQADINSTLATLRYQGNANYTGADTLVLTSQDGAGLSDTDSVTLAVTAVNDAPNGSAATLAVNKNGSLALQRADFGFADAAGEGHAFQSVRVQAPSAGLLRLAGVSITSATEVTVAQLDAGSLVFTPAAGASGTAYATLGFQVRDDGGSADGGVDLDPVPRTLTFDVSNGAPAITSNGGGASANLSLAENTAAVATVTATDPDGDALIYSIAGGADAALFQIDPASGALSFRSADVPDFELPTDADVDNVYAMTVRAFDGTLGVNQAINVAITDIAGPLVVTTTADVVDGSTGSLEALIASPGADGKISLREAVIAANNTAGADVIQLPAGTFTLTRPGTNEKAALTGDLNLSGTLTLQGAGSALTIVDGAGIDRVFDLRSGAVASLSGLTVQGGAVGANWGGGINVEFAGSSLTLNDVRVTANTGSYGAGIYDFKSTLVIIDSTLDANSGRTGVGLYNDGGSTSLTRATVSNNLATEDGAGLYSGGVGATLQLSNVTLSGNQTSGSGGGLYARQAVTIDSSTIAFNSAASGGGVFLFNTGSASLLNTIVAANVGGNANTPLTSLGSNIDSGNTLGLAQPGDLVNTDPGLDATLQANGGLTRTHALLPGSAAIDAGDTLAAPVSDQRGSARVGSADIGAYESALAADRAPVNALPAAQAVLEDMAAAIAGVAVSDPDDGGGVALYELATTALSVSNGTLQVTLSGAASISAGVNASAAFTLSGNPADINSTLATLRYLGNANYVGADTLVLSSQDGVGLTDTDSVAISVLAVNDAPRGSDATLALPTNGSLALARADFGFSDAPGEGHGFASVRVQPPSAGSVRLNGTALAAATDVTVAQLDAGQLVFVPAALAAGSPYATLAFQVRDDGGSASGGTDLDLVPNLLTFNVSAGGVANGELWFSTAGPVAAAGGTSWSAGQIARYGDAGDSFNVNGGGTSGTVSLLPGFSAPAPISGLHHVQSTLTLGTTGTQFALNPGDLVLVLDPGAAPATVSLNLGDGDTANDLTVDRRDIVVFRPSLAGNYASGTYLMLLDDGLHDAAPTAGSPPYNPHAISIVETDTLVGGTLLPAGTIVLAHSTAALQNNVYTLGVIGTGVGALTQTTDTQLLLDGATLGLAGAPADPYPIQGLHLLTQATSFNGTVLAAGTLLVAVNGSDTVAGVAHGSFDVVALTITRTERNGGTLASGQLLFDGAGIGLSVAGEPLASHLSSLTVVTAGSSNTPPTVTSPATAAVAEGSMLVHTLTSTDPESQPVSLAINGGADAARFIIDGANRLLFASVPDHEAPVDADGNNVYEVQVRASDSAGAVVLQSVFVTVTNVNETPLAAPVDLDVMAEDGVRLITQAELLAGASDADGDPLSASGLAVLGGRGNLFDRGDGSWIFTPQRDWNGPVTFTYQVADASSAVANAAGLAVQAVADAPLITSHGGGAQAVLAAPENAVALTSINASDADGATTFSFAISGGADALAFSIDAASGALRFVNPPDREAPGDADGDGRYEVLVSASDGGLSAQQRLVVTVTNVDEPPQVLRNQLRLEGALGRLDFVSTDPDTPVADLQYQLSGVQGGQFELATAPGQPLLAFSQGQVSAGLVRFVRDTSGLAVDYVLALSDGAQTVPGPAAQVLEVALLDPAPPAPLAPSQAVPEPALVVAAPATAGQEASPSPEAGTNAAPMAAPAPVRSDAAPGTGTLALDAGTASTLRAQAPGGDTPPPRGHLRALAFSDAAVLPGLPSDDSTALAAARLGVQDVVAALRERSYTQALDRVRDELGQESRIERDVVGSTAMVSASLSVGYVLWLARGGVLVATLMSALPAWAGMDPLPVLARLKRGDDDDDDDGAASPAPDDPLEKLFSKARQLIRRPAAPPPAQRAEPPLQETVA